ncbi:BLUF domain-containing protein [Aurantiacibacter sediminis]|uniref:BLUF domain-containing protein n=1 Tax=Aurantiacibacter sediminis TaxID=2793064 RepID=A0ABS0N1Q4_9SPHN|nr:BLUF domain-containing protein [Aurantiacibacter sediminis]MBH5321886.1 BLUF domain-containing protein [Aurantiacibacter sediminis]
MLSLIYVSTAQERMPMAAVEAMAERSAARNHQAGITGMLAYNGRSFMQLLEGDGEAVLATMRRIERDPRHSNISYVRQEMRFQRECPDWSMKTLLAPLSKMGSATVFTQSLPRSTDLDTRILFTSFASSIGLDTAAKLEERRQHVVLAELPVAANA